LSSSWQNTGFEGSLMMRPVFVSDKDLALSLKEKFWNPSVNIYPNPASDIINIQVENGDATNIEIYDMQGKIVLQDLLNGNNTSLNVSSLTNGLYILSLKNEQNQTVQKKISIFK